MLNYKETEEAFTKYLKNFSKEQAQIKKKRLHSERVAEIAERLGKEMGLKKEQIELVKILGLLHDLGRFEQFRQYQTYNDFSTQFDHAKESVHYLFEENHIVEFVSVREYDEVMKKAILNHNRFQIEEALNSEEQFYVHFLRDIDKIDIFRQEAVSAHLHYPVPVSKEVKKLFEKNQLIPLSLLKNDTDHIVKELAYLFDFHFREALEFLVETDNYNLFFDSIEVDPSCEEEFYELRDIAYQYLINRLENYNEIS